MHIQCAFDYFEEEMKQKFFEKIARNDEKQCGTVEQDIAGTLQGNWFFQNARADSGSDWDKYLAFVFDNLEPAKQVISVGGTFTNAGTWKFNPTSTGTINRSFAQVTPDGKIYCYESSNQEGRIIVRMQSETQLIIEHQNQKCSDNVAFQKSATYNR